MNQHTQAISEDTMAVIGERLRAINWARAAVLYARVALGAAFLSRGSFAFRIMGLDV